MKQIYIFTDEYHDALIQRLPDAVPHNFGGLACFAARDNGATVALAEVAAQIKGADASCCQDFEAEFRDFLSENDYIHLDVFIRICLEDTDDE